MDVLAEKSIDSVQRSQVAYCKFITANDTGETGGHQAGYHIHKEAWPLIFDTPGVKGSNKDNLVTIKWNNDFETPSRFIYYGVGTRNEYRLTRFGKGFPYLTEDNTGDLLVLAKHSSEYYEAFVLRTEEDIESFLSAFGLSPSEANRIIERKIDHISPDDLLLKCFEQFIKSVNTDFPPTLDLASNARSCYLKSYRVTEKQILDNPDKELLMWLEAEYKLFKSFESDRYSEKIKSPFQTVEQLVEFSNTILNRRKSRAGKSLEHHLSYLFDLFKIKYSVQATTEENKKPDFLFPGADAYHDSGFDSEKLTFLACKTTCKDRWRQILNEADRIKYKHLFTLQQGISRNQLSEMYNAGVRLVIPKSYLSTFPADYRDRILTLETFLKAVS